MWTSLPSSLLHLLIEATDGKVDPLPNPAFIDSLKWIPPGIISFSLRHLLYPFTRPYLDSKGEFCFPQPFLDLAKSHSRLAYLKICFDELDLSRIDCNPLQPTQESPTTQRERHELPYETSESRKAAKKRANDTPYDV